MVPVWSYEVTENALRSREDALHITERDKELLNRALPLVEPLWPSIIDGVYERLMRIPEAACLLKAPGTLERLKQSQLAYLKSLFEGNHDLDHAQRLIRIGLKHYQLHITPQLYIATYAIIIKGHTDILLDTDSRSEYKFETLNALMRAIYYDMNFVLDAYGSGEIIALQKRIKDQVSSETSFPKQTRARVISEDSIEPQSVQRIYLTSGSVEERCQLFDLTSLDSARLRKFGSHIDQKLPSIINNFYEKIGSHAELTSHLDERVVNRLKSELVSYWRELTTGAFNRPYAISRIRIGKVHEEIGLSLQWYFAGLIYQLTSIINSSDPEALDSHTINALLKAVFFDVTFVIDAYMAARVDSMLNSTEFAHDLVAGMPSAIAVIDHESRVLSANASFIEIFPGDAGLLYRMPIDMAMPLKELKMILERIKEQKEHRAVAICKLSSRNMKLTAMRLNSQDNIPTQNCAIIFDDISEVLELAGEYEGNQNRLEQMLSSLDVLLWEFDLKSRSLIYVSNKVTELTGYRYIYFLGKPNAWLEIISPEDQASVLKTISQMTVGKTYTLEYRIRHIDGEDRWVRSNLIREDSNDESSCIRGFTVEIESSSEQVVVDSNSILNS